MLKRFTYLLLLMVLVGGLIACDDSERSASSDNSNNNKTEEKKDNKEKEEKEEEIEEESNSNNEDVQESEIGKLSIAYKDKELDENAESGPINLNVDALQVGELEVSEDYQEFFDGKDEVTTITISMNVENTDDNTNGFYPDQATITTDAGDQVDADMLLSDEVGGDFIGKVKKDGQVIFTVDSDADEINEINLFIDGTHDEDFENIGEDIEMTFNID
ncbi:MAG TPA: hypothetical protein VK111_12965 [Virgibacillus sp.]|nr:hypothetical protein [Virgibacillus sp.]